VSEEELMTTYRKFGSRLEGHPTPVLPWADVATGSLGQGLPDGVGVGLAGKYLDQLPYKVWVLCGDSEMAEGSIWEALDKASHYGLSNVVAIVDVNRLGQRGPTELEWDLKAYAARAEAFGARVITIDGHDLKDIDRALALAASGDEGIDAKDAAKQAKGKGKQKGKSTKGTGKGTVDQPTVILARTIKGRGFAEVENHEGWHGKPFPPDMAARAIAQLGGERDLLVRGPRPRPGTVKPLQTGGLTPMPTYSMGDRVATRKAYGDALAALGSRDDRIVALDGEVSNSTHADEFARAFPDRYFEMFIAEQQMLGSAMGLAARDYRPFASTFAAFLTRAHDFIRMAAISGLDVRLVGSHAGVEIGADGPSQMGLEDLAMMRALPGSTVLYPCDATSTAALVEQMPGLGGVTYLRTTRGSYPVLYDAGESFPVGGCKVLRSSSSDAVTLVAAGVTVHECLAAADRLAEEDIHARVIDLYSVKPLDMDTLSTAAEVTQGRVVVVEDHYPQGGLGSAVSDALLTETRTLRLAHLCVRELPGSGTSAELLAAAGIDAQHIETAARALLTRK
jgi:transketolase